MTHDIHKSSAIKPAVPRPKHEQLRDYLLGELDAGRLNPGDALPREVELAKTMSVARNTVRQALAELERQGLIRRIRGRGTFVHEDASSKRKSPVGIFALVVPESRRGYYPSLLHGFGEAVRHLGGQVIVVDTDNEIMRQADVLLHLLDQNVSGIALVPAYDTPAHHIRPLQRHNIPVVCCHRAVPSVNAPLIGFDGKRVGKLAAQAICEHRHRHAAYFAASSGGLATQYLEGFREGLTQAGLALPDSHVFRGESIHPSPEHDKSVAEALRRMLALPDAPTAIMTSFDSEAELLYLLLMRMGISVPEQISLVSFGGSYREGPVLKRLAAVEVDEEQLGRRTAELLHEMLCNKRRLDDQSRVEIPLTFRTRETLSKPQAITPDTAADSLSIT